MREKLGGTARGGPTMGSLRGLQRDLEALAGCVAGLMRASEPQVCDAEAMEGCIAGLVQGGASNVGPTMQGGGVMGG